VALDGISYQEHQFRGTRVAAVRRIVIESLNQHQRIPGGGLMNVQNYKCSGVFMLGLFAFWSGPLEAAGLIGIDNGGHLISLNTSTGVGTLIGASGVPGPSSLVSSPDGTFYTVGSDLRLYTINPATGVGTIGPALSGLGATFFLNGLAFSAGGVLYADALVGSSNTSLFTINKTTGVATLVGQISPDSITDIAFSPSGTLYAWDAATTNGGLMTVDIATGAGTLVKSGLTAVADIRALRFDAAGNLYAAGLTNFYTINPATSVPTLIGPTGFTDVRGIAFTPVYYFSQLAFGGVYHTTLTYINYSPQVVTCTTNFYSDIGGALSIPFGQGTISSRTDILQPGQSIHDQSVAGPTAAGAQGWAQASCSGPIQASVLYRYTQSGAPVGEAGVNAETTPTTKFVTFAQTATGVAYANPSTTQSATITLTLISTAGAPLGNQVLTLGPLAHGSANLGPLLGLQSFTGFVEIASTIPIISLSLNAEVFPVFSSLPPGDLPSLTTLVTP
jgi:hypothetical protein